MSKTDKDTAMKYIKGYFKEKYPISTQIQPHFWEAVALLCEDMDTDVSSLINENNPWCLERRKRGTLVHFSHLKSNCKEKTLNELAHTIASEIIEVDSFPVERVDVFLLQKKVEYLSEKVLYFTTDRTRGLY